MVVFFLVFFLDCCCGGRWWYLLFPKTLIKRFFSKSTSFDIMRNKHALMLIIDIELLTLIITT